MLEPAVAQTLRRRMSLDLVCEESRYGAHLAPQRRRSESDGCCSACDFERD